MNVPVITNQTSIETEIEIMTPACVAYVDKYRLFTKQTAEAIIKAAETLYEAHETLAPVDFHQFCKEVDLVEDGSKFKKLMAIGKAVSRFEPYLDRMPNAWTTIYKLATLDGNEFEQVVQSASFAPFMTANDIDVALKGPKAKGKAKLAKDTDGLVIDLSGLAKTVQRDVYRQLRELRQTFGFGVTANGEFKAIANAVELDASLDDLYQVTSQSPKVA
jgi:hypothetical protein